MSSGRGWRLSVLAAVAAGFLGGTASAEDKATLGPWDVEQFRTGLVAVSRSDDKRTALLIFCTLLGTRNVRLRLRRQRHAVRRRSNI